MNTKIKLISIFCLIFLLFGCSLNSKSKFWSSKENLKKDNNIIEKDVFKKTKIYKKEFNPTLKINLKNEYQKHSFVNNLTNNNGIIDYDGKLEKISKFKFSKINNFNQYQPELLISNSKSIIFFDDKGTILNFDENSDLLWKKNIYSKNEKKTNPILYLASNDKYLVVVDNIANLYALNINNGNLIWKKRNSSPFNSQIKIFKDKFFAIDFENTIKCFSINSGKEIWSYKTDKSLIMSQQKLSLIINKKNNKVIFINSLGDLTSIDADTGELFWQAPTQSTDIFENAFLLKNSDIILANETIFFSNNKNEMFAIDEKTGFIKWKQTINSNLRPTFSNNLLFTVSLEGYLIIIDPRNGNILRISNIFKKFKKSKIKKLKPVGFILGKKYVYTTLNNGRLILTEISESKIDDVIKLSNEMISRPYIFNNKMYIVKDNSILQLN